MIIDLHTALESVESYFTNDRATYTMLGCMCGTQLFKHIFDLSLGYFAFGDILLIEGCQDFMGMSEPSPSNNHFHYSSLLSKKPVHSLFNEVCDLFSFKILNNGNPVSEYKFDFNIQFINRFNLVIVCDAHLIPQTYLAELMKYVSSKLIILVDPFTIFGKAFVDVPTVVNSTCECDELTALARDVYNVETPFIKSGQKMLNVLDIAPPKTTNRFIGNQYVTNDPPYYELMLDKLNGVGIKKDFKYIVPNNQLMFYDLEKIDDSMKQESISVNQNSLINIVKMDGSLGTTLFTCNLNKYKRTFRAQIELLGKQKPFTMDTSTLKVIPGSLLTIEQAAYHKFDKLTFVQSGYGHKLSKQELYTLMNMTEHLTIVEEK